jgi:hypothetical protein
MEGRELRLPLIVHRIKTISLFILDSLTLLLWLVCGVVLASSYMLV